MLPGSSKPALPLHSSYLNFLPPHTTQAPFWLLIFANTSECLPRSGHTEHGCSAKLIVDDCFCMLMIFCFVCVFAAMRDDMGAIHRRRQDIGSRSLHLSAKRKLARLPSIVPSSEKVIGSAAGSAPKAWRTSPAISKDWVLFPSISESTPSQNPVPSIEGHSDYPDRTEKVEDEVAAEHVRSRDRDESRDPDSDVNPPSPPRPQRIPTPDLAEIDEEEFFGCCDVSYACDASAGYQTVADGMLNCTCCPLSVTHHCASLP